MTTVKEIAERCGVSEQAVRAWCRRNQVAKDAKASFVIDETIESSIYAHYGVDVSQHAKADAKDDAKHDERCFWELKAENDRLRLEKDLEIKNLQEQLRILQEEIDRQNEQISGLQRLLDQEQQIRMASMMRLEDKSAKKKWWQVWK